MAATASLSGPRRSGLRTQRVMYRGMTATRHVHFEAGDRRRPAHPGRDVPHGPRREEHGAGRANARGPSRRARVDRTQA